MSTNLKACSNFIIIKAIIEEEKIGNLLVVHQGKKIPTKGLVMSIGAKIKSVKIGDIVLFKKWEANEIKWEGQELLVLEDKQLLAILK